MCERRSDLGRAAAREPAVVIADSSPSVEREAGEAVECENAPGVLRKRDRLLAPERPFPGIEGIADLDAYPMLPRHHDDSLDGDRVAVVPDPLGLVRTLVHDGAVDGHLHPDVGARPVADAVPAHVARELRLLLLAEVPAVLSDPAGM